MLWVLEDNHEAQQAYKRLGFIPTGQRQALPDETDRFALAWIDISTGEFLTEMILGVPRGARRMWRDTCDNPLIVGGVVGTIVAKVVPKI